MFEGDPDLAAVAIVFHSVGEKVHADLLEALPIGPDVDVRAGRTVHNCAKVARVCQWPHHADRFIHYVGDLHRLERQLQLSRLDTAQVEHFVDQRQ